MITLSFSICILSWKSPKTLHNTLSSYRDNGLLDLTEDISIFFQEVSRQDIDTAEEFGITNIVYSESNIGIGPAIKQLVENAKYDNVLFLENDWELMAKRYMTERVIRSSVVALESNTRDFIRLRSNSYPGEPLYTRQFKGREMDSPEHLIEGVHGYGIFLANLYPEFVNIVNYDGVDFIHTDSKYGNYSNNPFMCKKDFYLKHVAPADQGGISLEGEIRKTWREAGHRVAFNIPGLFTHNRID